MTDPAKLKRLHRVIASAIKQIEESRTLAQGVKCNRRLGGAMSLYDKNLTEARRLLVRAQVCRDAVVPTGENTF